MNDPKMAAIYMHAVAALAMATAMDLDANKLWPGDFSLKVRQIYENLDRAVKQMGDDR